MIDNIIAELKKYGIIIPLEIAHFLAQTAEESSFFTQFGENDKYTFGRAKVIWPTKLALILNKQEELNALDIALCPQPWLFNQMYGDRLGNEDNGLNDDDGYNFRGAGLIQLTGRDDYEEFVQWLHDKTITLDTARQYCLTFEGAVKSAIWYWISHHIGVLALKDDIIGVTKAVNGGIIGLIEREQFLTRFKKMLGI